MPLTTPGAWARRTALACHAALVAALPLLAGVLGLVAVVPLLVPAPGLWRGHRYTYAWCSLLLVLYTGGFLMEAFTHPPRRAAALALAIVGALECCALLLFVRIEAAALRRAA